jgi:ABC-type branched-subunit amino acid transport system ATPase component/branched-subunit amino acid ABC-type transport system permease component
VLNFVQFLVLGLTGAAAYGLSALGVVVIYRGSRVLNFAQGATGMVGTYVFYELYSSGQGLWLAIPVGLLAAAAAGLATYLCVMYPLRRAPMLARLMGTFGVLLILTGAATVIYGQNTRFIATFLPPQVWHFGSGGFVSVAAIVTFATTIVLAVLMILIFRWTRFGQLCSAIEDDRLAASVLGISEVPAGCLTWALGGALAAMAGILLAPVIGLSPSALTLLVIPALAAGLPGNFHSIPWAILTATAIGCGQSLITGYGLPSADVQTLPLAAVVLVLALRGRSIPERGESLLVRLPALGSGRIRIGVVFVLVAIPILVMIALPNGFALGLTFSMAACLIGCAIVVATGYAGQLSLAPMAIAGLGAIVTANLARPSIGLPWYVAAVFGVLAATLAGTIVGVLAARIRGVNLAVATLAFALAVQDTVLTADRFTGGYVGIMLPTPSFFGTQISLAGRPKVFATLALALAALSVIAVLNIRRGASGRRYAALRSNERGAASLGVSVPGTKIAALAVSSVYAGLAGCLLLFTTSVADFSRFDLFTSITLLGYAIVGGVGFAASGSLLAGLGAAGGIVGYFLNNITSLAPYLSLIGGALVIQMLISYPDGVGGFIARASARVSFRWRSSPRPQTDAQGTGDITPAGAVRSTTSRTAARAEPLLQVRNVSKTFGASPVLRDVQLQVLAGEIVGLVGANGAGKSTLIDIVSGFTRAGDGDVLVSGAVVTRSSIRRRCTAGLTRTFQNLELFEDLSVRENIMVAMENHKKAAYAVDLVVPRSTSLPQNVLGLVRTLGLRRYLDQKVAEIPQGPRRMTALVRCLALSPKVVCLDEPAAGLNESERSELVTALRSTVETTSIGILLVEHSMDVIRRACDRVVVLDFGEVIGQGDPDEVLDDPDVRASFLGKIGA